jgi:hypothetical protein
MRVSYHVRRDDRYYSYSYLHDTRTEAEEDCEQRSELAIVHPIELDQQYFGVYTTEKEVSKVPLEVNLPESDDGTQKLVETVRDLFEYIDEEQSLDWYKKPEFSGVADAINRVQWRQPVSEVGGELLSRLILRHGLPNANHRTAIAFLQTYLETLKPGTGVPETNVGDEWSGWTNGFIVDSKKLLTVRRNASGFQYLAERGATVLERKGDVEIHLDNYETTTEDPWSHFRQQHENRSSEFVVRYIKRAEADELLKATDGGKRAFADRL